MKDTIERFTSRVENYVEYRPSYPVAIIELLAQECGLTDDSIIADIGSGTGKLAELFLPHARTVFGVEPNREMREAGERLLRPYAHFKSLDATAEQTTLPDHSVDFVIAGQAFHWFEMAAARREFTRILKPGGWVVIIWNERQLETTPFLVAYEAMLRTYGTDYEKVTHTNFDEPTMARFFGDNAFKLKVFPNLQVFDLESLQGRLCSSSYTPEAGHPNFAPMLVELERIFRAYQVNGTVDFIYDTKVYYGHLSSTGHASQPALS